MRNVVFIIFISVCFAAKKWPSYLPKCYRNDPNLNDCILQATRTIKPFLQKGIPELKVLPISPFTVPEVVINEPSYNFLMKNLIITGFDNYEYEKFNFDTKNLNFDLLLRVGQLNMNCQYSAKGKLLNIPFEQNGTLGIMFGSTNATMKQNATIVKKNGIDFMKLHTPEINLEFHNIHNLTSDISENDVIGRATRKVIQENLEEFTNAMKPAILKVVEGIISDIQRKIFEAVPFDEVYPIKLD